MRNSDKILEKVYNDSLRKYDERLQQLYHLKIKHQTSLTPQILQLIEENKIPNFINKTIDDLENDICNLENDIKDLTYEHINDLMLIESKAKLIQQKNTLIFSGLFKPEFVEKLDDFFQSLKKHEFINNNNEWMKTNLSEPARIYFYLKEKGIIKTIYKDTPALKCFYKQFGITVYENNKKPETDCKSVTRENVTSSFAKDFSSIEDKFNRYFLPLFTQK